MGITEKKGCWKNQKIIYFETKYSSCRWQRNTRLKKLLIDVQNKDVAKEKEATLMIALLQLTTEIY